MSHTVSPESGRRHNGSAPVRRRASPYAAVIGYFLDVRGNPSASIFARDERHPISIFRAWLIIVIGLMAITFLDDGVSAQRRPEQQSKPADIYEQKRAESTPTETGVPDGGELEGTLVTEQADSAGEQPSREELDRQGQIFVTSIIQALTALTGLTGLGYTVWFAFQTWRK